MKTEKCKFCLKTLLLFVHIQPVCEIHTCKIKSRICTETEMLHVLSKLDYETSCVAKIK